MDSTNQRSPIGGSKTSSNNSTAQSSQKSASPLSRLLKPKSNPTSSGMGNESSTSISSGKGGGGVSSGNGIMFEGRLITAVNIREMKEDFKGQIDRQDVQLEDIKCALHEAEMKIRELEQENCELKELQQGDRFSGRSGTGPPATDGIGTIASRSKKQGVSGESGQQTAVELKHHPKNESSQKLIQQSLEQNEFLSKMEGKQVTEMVQCMYEKKVASDCYIIREGDDAEHLYVCVEGEFLVTKDGKLLGKMGPGRSFGELALLYNCKRTASVKAISTAKVWVLDRSVFQTIMVKTGLQRQEEVLRFLKSVPLLKELQQAKLVKIADVLEDQFHRPEECIIRQGENGSSFFIIQSGKVRVTQKSPDNDQEVTIREMGKGEYFGEKALLSEEKRTASVYALESGVDVLCLYRKDFLDLIGKIDELKNRQYDDGNRTPSTSSTTSIKKGEPQISKAYQHLTLQDFETLSTLGMGGFGRVEMVALKSDKTKTFALKCLKKQHIVNTRQQDHVYSERKILLEVDSHFICKLYRTFKDNKYVFMLMEVCQGGELWTILRDKGHFDDATARFYLACVIEAFDYLHARDTIYRDLKPENLLLDSKGIIKVCDFGFAKRLGQGRKTWTFCGTPEYVAPEVILNKGHDFTCDYWSLGILTFELLTGSPPFSANDPMRIYNLILKGIDTVDINHNRHVSSKATQLIRKLCRQNPSDRLGNGRGGIGDIKKNKYFQGFDWDGLAKLIVTPPIKPKVTSPTDHSNFDNFPKDTEIPPDETSGWDNDF